VRRERTKEMLRRKVSWRELAGHNKPLTDRSDRYNSTNRAGFTVESAAQGDGHLGNPAGDAPRLCRRRQSLHVVLERRERLSSEEPATTFARRDTPRAVGERLRIIGPGLVLAATTVGIGDFISTRWLGNASERPTCGRSSSPWCSSGCPDAQTKTLRMSDEEGVEPLGCASAINTTVLKRRR
jgi:hypothetical protein